MKKAFTLIEVNLAVLVMAGAVLSVVVLFSLGFRESRQNREDLASAAYADAVMSPLVAALGSSELAWSDFDKLEECYPTGGNDENTGWGLYLNSDGKCISDPTSKAQTAFSGVMGKLGSSGVSASWPSGSDGGLQAGLVVIRPKGSAIARIAFRATKRTDALLAAPLYLTEVRFQGKQE